MIGRRDALAFIGAAAYVGATGCGGPGRTQPPAGGPHLDPPLSLDPLVNLVSAAGLVWLIDMRPVDLLASPGIAKAIELAVPGDHFDAFARRHGGIDPRRATHLVLAGFADVTLALAQIAVDPARIEKAFADRAVAVEGRAVDRGITRLWGSVGEEREQIAIFGDQAIGIERGHFSGPCALPAISRRESSNDRRRPFAPIRYAPHPNDSVMLRSALLHLDRSSGRGPMGSAASCARRRRSGPRWSPLPLQTAESLRSSWRSSSSAPGDPTRRARPSVWARRSTCSPRTRSADSPRSTARRVAPMWWGTPQRCAWR